MEVADAWAELLPAFGYHGNKRTWSHLEEGSEMQLTPQIAENCQFALEIDHFCKCIFENTAKREPREQGLRDHFLMEAIYHSAASDGVVKLA